MDRKEWMRDMGNQMTRGGFGGLGAQVGKALAVSGQKRRGEIKKGGHRRTKSAPASLSKGHRRTRSGASGAKKNE